MMPQKKGGATPDVYVLCVECPEYHYILNTNFVANEKGV